MITATLLTIFKMWTQPSSLLREEQIKKTWYIYTAEHDSAIKGERNQVYLVPLNHFAGMKNAHPRNYQREAKQTSATSQNGPVNGSTNIRAEESAEETDFSSYPLGMRMATTSKVAVWVFLKQF